MRKLWTAALCAALTLVFSGKAKADPIQLGFLIDGSSSISSAEFNLIRTGLSQAILSAVPIDSSVEITVVQFATGTSVVVAPTLITSAATRSSVAATIASMTQLGGTTNLAGGITALTAQITGSPSFSMPGATQIFDIVTDGDPNSESAAVTARNAALAAGIDEINAEAVDAPGTAITFLQTQIVAPQPGVLIPPTGPFPANQGFVVVVDSFDDFAGAIQSKIESIVQPPSAVPEPSTMVLAGIGVLSLVGHASRRKKRAA